MVMEGDALNPVEIRGLDSGSDCQLSIPPSATCIQGNAEAEWDGVSQPLQKFPVLSELSMCPIFLLKKIFDRWS